MNVIEETRITVRGSRVRTTVRQVKLKDDPHADVCRYCKVDPGEPHQPNCPAKVLVKVPVGSYAVLTAGEEPIVVTIDPKCLEFAELWFVRSLKVAHLIKQDYEEKSWLCLFNGCLVPELKAKKANSPRYEPRPHDNAFSARDGAWTVVDTHTMSRHTYPKGEYALVVHVDKKEMALKVANALNASEGYPKASQYVPPKTKLTRRKNGR